MSTDTIHPKSKRCRACGARLPQLKPDEKRLNFCPQCGTPLGHETEVSLTGGAWEHDESLEKVSLKRDAIEGKDGQFSIGPYPILDKIARGGMGEVYLAYDPMCGRRVALKKIRKDLAGSKKLFNRFVREARVTSQLTHPAVIPIYQIHRDDEGLYYTMPFVEGKTLKQILRETKKQEDEGDPLNQATGAIPTLIRIFLTVCQSIAYAHSRGVLHRDIKPENVIVGHYGQVVILDWGLAKLLGDRSTATEDEDDDIPMVEESTVDLTIPGKVVGTVSYMAPERAKGEPASIQTDIYALGVTLYQLLTLRQPFRRGSLSEFRKDPYRDVLPDPAQVAPYRDVPQILSRIVEQCLEPDVDKRYHSVDELIHDLEIYIEGRSEWFPVAELDPNVSKDWEFQEHVLLADHIAITRHREEADWVTLMVSKASFPENAKIEARVRVNPGGQGLGILMSIPEGAERSHLSEGYCLWLGAPDGRDSSQLYRSNVEVLSLPECSLTPGEWHDVTVEKVDNRITFSLDGTLQFNYTSYLPLSGTHVGLVAKDGAFDIQKFEVLAGNLNLTVSRLAVPDAFLSARIHDKALEEYRRIGASFPGRAEGREAMFRAGVTILDQARSTSDVSEADCLYDEALDEFSKLHHTPGAPLEYLGKSLVYKALRDYREEINCLELGVRRYRKHPLARVLQEQILYRLHDTSRLNRQATYRFVLLAIQVSPVAADSPNSRHLFSSLKKHWEQLPLFEEKSEWEEEFRSMELRGKWNFGITLAFWLRKPFSIREILEEVLAEDAPDLPTLGNALFAWLFMDATRFAVKILERLSDEHDASSPMWPLLQRISLLLELTTSPASDVLDRLLDACSETLNVNDLRSLYYMCEYALDHQQTSLVHQIADAVSERGDRKELIDSYRIWAFLLDQQWERAESLLDEYSEDCKLNEDSPLLFLNGCYLAATAGVEAAKAHFSVIFGSAQPRSWGLLGAFVHEKIDLQGEWFTNAFWWEKRQLYRQLSLYYHCTGDVHSRDHYRERERKELENEL